MNRTRRQRERAAEIERDMLALPSEIRREIRSASRAAGRQFWPQLKAEGKEQMLAGRLRKQGEMICQTVKLARGFGWPLPS